MKTEHTYSIGEIAEMTGVSKRTVRFYVQRGLINPPKGRGRGSHYTERHVEQIIGVRDMQRRGVRLDSIRETRREQRTTPPMSSQHRVVVRVDLAPGLVLEVDSAGLVPSPAALSKIADSCRDILAKERLLDIRNDNVNDDE